MSIVQSYVVTAADGKAAALDAVLHRMAELVRPIAGCEGVSILADTKVQGRYMFMETYADQAAYDASKGLVPKEILTELMSLLAGKPDVLTLSTVLDI